MQWCWVGVGAAFGAMLRFALSSAFNHVHPAWPLGTWLANILGGLLMGVVLGLAHKISPEMRLLWATGFLGGLTTFSTFSAETFVLLNSGRGWAALALVLLHVVGSILATALGWWVVTRWGF